MTSPNAPDPVTLAKIAAQLNPQLACDDPAKAIELARKLLIAADPELTKQEAERAEEMQLQRETQRHDKLFPLHELISVCGGVQSFTRSLQDRNEICRCLAKRKTNDRLRR